MTDAWDGRPQNPERDGAHWITDNVAYWEADRKRWLLMMKAKAVSAEWLAAQPWAEYRGPCLTPAEVEARVAEARREALEEAARRAEEQRCMCGGPPCQVPGYGCGVEYYPGDEIAAAIRALKEKAA